MKVELIAITPDVEGVIEMAGRTCYKSEPGDRTIIQRWIKSGHTSVIEHSLVTFKLTNVTRAFTHQLVRHRIGSFSQESQRYVDGSNFNYVIPNEVINNEDETLVEQYDDFMDKTRDFYSLLREKGIKKENARSILPNAATTEIVVSFNFRSLRNLFSLRLKPSAQEEFRMVAKKMLDIVKPLAPNVFFDFEI